MVLRSLYLHNLPDSWLCHYLPHIDRREMTQRYSTVPQPEELGVPNTLFCNTIKPTNYCRVIYLHFKSFSVQCMISKWRETMLSTQSEAFRDARYRHERSVMSVNGFCRSGSQRHVSQDIQKIVFSFYNEVTYREMIGKNHNIFQRSYRENPTFSREVF